MMPIKFGTDGWRAIIAEGYTFENLNIVSQATAAWISEENITNNGVVIGYDARFLSREFAEHAASVFAECGLPVRISDAIVATPVISWAASHFNATGIVITASHNPPIYNGFKIKAPFGGSASPDQIEAVEKKLKKITEPVSVRPFNHLKKLGLIREMDFAEGYLDVISERIDIDAIKKSGITIGHDPMFGSGSGLLKRLLKDQVLEINATRDPLFGGKAPEPMEQNMVQLSAHVLKNGCSLGIANDGDADRIGMVDENGKFVSSHLILSLLAKYLTHEKGLTGTIVKTFSTTDMLNKQAKAYGLPIEVTPIGFKYVADKIITGDVLVGGEESGGVSAKGHLPERDGIYIGLLITEMIVKSGKTFSQLVQALFDEFGNHEYFRRDVHTDDEKKKGMIRFCTEKKLKQIAGKNVVEWDMTDGIKHTLEDGSWLLVRQSGTEPVLRIYSEAEDKAVAESLVNATVEWLNKPEILM
ncbi:MAG: phosphoglucomutase/phosphomannomutase family protein [Balneolaceae bacterium]|nr:MAG: phosphoglucomutase/phosphomannomutase family protein [Balneolaceae bacterium]